MHVLHVMYVKYAVNVMHKMHVTLGTYETQNNVYIYRDFKKAKWQTFTTQRILVGCKVQSVLCEDAMCLNRVIAVWRSLYKDQPREEIKRRAIVVVYIKL